MDATGLAFFADLVGLLFGDGIGSMASLALRRDPEESHPARTLRDTTNSVSRLVAIVFCITQPTSRAVGHIGLVERAGRYDNSLWSPFEMGRNSDVGVPGMGDVYGIAELLDCAIEFLN